MDVALTDEQELLRSTTARFIESSCPLSVVRSLIDDEVGFDRGYLRKGAELGWFALLVPHAFGGAAGDSGDALIEAAIVAEERGRVVQPGPFVPMNVVAAALAAAGSDTQQSEVLRHLLAGEAVASWAFAGDQWDLGPGIVATPTAGGFSITGTAPFVQDAHAADWLLVTATTLSGSSQFLVPTHTPGVATVALESLDLACRVSEVTFTDVRVDETAIVGEIDGAGEQVERQLLIALVLTIAESIGTMDRLFEITVQYAKDRIAFGRPVGSFQAIKHLLADLSFMLEASKAGAVAATKAAQANTSNAAAVASMAKSFVGDASMELAQGCLQVHGGIGYTWEHDLHLYLRRLAANNALYGEPSWHRERLCAIHGL